MGRIRQRARRTKASRFAWISVVGGAAFSGALTMWPALQEALPPYVYFGVGIGLSALVAILTTKAED